MLVRPGKEKGAAERAGDLSDVDPLVDAGLVEEVGAVPELPDLVAGLERGEADGAGWRGGGSESGEANDGEAVVYRFDTKDDRDRVLQGGPYFAFGVPIFQKIMSRCFLFHKDGRLVPAWIQIHGLPPDYWSQKVLSMIGSEVGKPLYTDSLTRSRERLEYARLLVEVPVIGDRIYEVPITLPTGVQLDLRIVYEMMPEYCETCKKIGHRKEDYGCLPRTGRARSKSAVVHPLDHDEVDAQDVHHEEKANAEELSTIPEVSSSKEASSSSADHRSQTDSSGTTRSSAPSSSAPSSSAASVTLGSTSSASSQVDSVRHKGKSKEVTGSRAPLQSGR
ncbi:uncharacterized protein LOC121987120 [Zingiber officinale]|uniref:uncharacterized protein LOC121987120 n=1 Tax=Zingiber officinale TaxID=94328 RepID=UPI001C4B3F1E|nr:uncharacterized protein LOC121987120 [Zingiber officinale]